LEANDLKTSRHNKLKKAHIWLSFLQKVSAKHLLDIHLLLKFEIS
jgi:hypothetical protein